MKLAFFQELDQAKNILIAGAGGGFDVFAGISTLLLASEYRQKRSSCQPVVFRSGLLRR
jgi:hypothetical protein